MANEFLTLASAPSPYVRVRGYSFAQLAPVPQTPRDPSRGFLLAPGLVGGELLAVTVNGAPAQRTVDLFEYASRAWVRSTMSTIDGIAAFDGLIVGREYMAIARDDQRIYND
ncbi:MAG: hypothetical protein J0I77_17900 [Rudaea sp.]|uniref:hypothetical protein n=1 Tax=unclassified Rudaea TaxID=2627037 RepID=UPI0010F7078E|nr:MULTISPECIES: hypothetical protein [unclassified Rudaea]MBN8887603.1 hypothetical protein [Rudaea sp.]